MNNKEFVPKNTDIKFIAKYNKNINIIMPIDSNILMMKNFMLSNIDNKKFFLSNVITVKYKSAKKFNILSAKFNTNTHFENITLSLSEILSMNPKTCSWGVLAESSVILLIKSGIPI